MGERTTAGLLADGFAQAHRGPRASAARTIAFRKGLVAADAPKPSFVEHQLNWMPKPRHIPFATLAHIVLFDADGSTMRTLGPISCLNHLDLQGSVRLQLLSKNAQSC